MNKIKHYEKLKCTTCGKDVKVFSEQGISNKGDRY